MILLRLFAAAALAVALAAAPSPASAMDKGDGIHTEAWFKNDSFLVLADDVAEAAAKGKLLAVIWEQEGCGSCQKLHDVNLKDAPVKAYLQQHFDVMTMNMYGEVEVTDFDGQKLPEKDLAFKQQVNFTPTTIFFDETGKEVFRLPGYFSPYFWMAGFVYVKEKGYADPEHRGMFPRWTKANRDALVKAYGSDPEG
ncbi:thioredoxin family protein [Novispirillum sp. DQ9]|uniref:thioredoxin family protein n=1 Tax=Novispirillum sp. DQ9 TaxID=3398612 RepID=UPI003C7D8FE8